MSAVDRQPFGGIIGHAFAALGHHIATHDLPAPHDVLVDIEPLRITVALRRDDWTAWLNTVQVLDETNAESEDAILGAYLVTHWQVRLDTGLLLTLRARREFPILQAVSA